MHGHRIQGTVRADNLPEPEPGCYQSCEYNSYRWRNSDAQHNNHGASVQPCGASEASCLQLSDRTALSALPCCSAAVVAAALLLPSCVMPCVCVVQAEVLCGTNSSFGSKLLDEMRGQLSIGLADEEFQVGLWRPDAPAAQQSQPKRRKAAADSSSVSGPAVSKRLCSSSWAAEMHPPVSRMQSVQYEQQQQPGDTMYASGPGRNMARSQQQQQQWGSRASSRLQQGPPSMRISSA